MSYLFPGKTGWSRWDERWKRWPGRLPVVVLAWGVALFVWGSRHVGNVPALRVARRLASIGSWYRPLCWDEVAPVDVVAIVHRLVPGTRGPGRCLFRTLVRFGILRQTGTDTATLWLGVRSPEAEEQFAHAWLEVDGVPVGEPSDPRSTHRRLVCVDGTGTGPDRQSLAVD
jgi:hypothetical protein